MERRDIIDRRSGLERRSGCDRREDGLRNRTESFLKQISNTGAIRSGEDRRAKDWQIREDRRKPDRRDLYIPPRPQPFRYSFSNGNTQIIDQGPIVAISSEAALETEASRFLFHWWRSRSQDGLLARITNIDLSELMPIAANMAIRDLLEDQSDFLIRYWGTELTHWFGVDGTKKKLRDFYPPGIWPSSYQAYKEITLTGIPAKSTFTGRLESVGDVFFEGVYLPLLGKNGRIEHIISVEQFIPQPDRKTIPS